MAYEETKTEVSQPAAQDVPDARKALVQKWVADIQKSEKHFEDEFKRMDWCMQVAAEGAEEQWVKDDKYTVPVVNRHINLSVSALYARDPSVAAKRRRKLMFQIWDGDPQSLEAAAMLIQPPTDPMTGAALPAGPDGMPWQPDPNAVALIQEVQQAKQYMRLLDKLGKSLEILWDHFTSEQSLAFKESMKALIRRVKVCGVGYVELSFQREMQDNPEIVSRIDDATTQLKALERLTGEAGAEGFDQNSAKAEELRTLVETLNGQLEIIAREGPLFDWPKAKEIIVDKNCTHLKTFAGARWVARKYLKTCDQVKEDYKADISGKFKAYTEDGLASQNGQGKPESYACVYRVQDKKNGQVFTVCDGYDDFLEGPKAPDVKIERFWTIFPLVFNEVEHDKKIYPPSDVWLLRHPQKEYNRAREGLREHRIAARPQYGYAEGSLTKKDKEKLEGGVAHAALGLKALKPGTGRVEDLVQQIKKAAIDPNVYETASQLDDIMRTVGTQEANLGPAKSDSATAASIAEEGRTASNADLIDDIDDMLTQLARAFGQLCLTELSQQTVQEICGPGAVWQEFQTTRDQMNKDLYLEIKAGSSGRPNHMAELAKMERVLPTVLQMPGMNPRPWAEKIVQLVDLGVDMEEVYVEGLPSIAALNAMAGKQVQPGTGDGNDPSQQGPKGGQNDSKPKGQTPGAQPAMPANARETQSA